MASSLRCTISLHFFISFSCGSCISRFNKFLNSKSKTNPPSQSYGAAQAKLQKLVARLLNWFTANARDLPWRRTRDAYAIWVSEIMLQQTQVKTVLPFWERWMRELPTIESVAAASADKIHKLWEGLGYYTRVRNLQKAAKQIVENRRDELNESQAKSKIGDSHSSSLRRNGKCEFPRNFDNVLALPGIGRYTAGAICSIAFNQPTPILDGNVIRVLTRIFGIAENPKEKETNAKLWTLAEDLVGLALRCQPRRAAETAPHQKTSARVDVRPTKSWNCSHLNQSLMELGALICTPRNPQCQICPVKKLCIAFKENRTEEFPNLGKREVATEKRVAAFLLERNGKFLVRQRPAGIVNAHLWEFPNIEMVNGNSNPKLAAKSIFGIEPKNLEYFHTLKHSITRYRITVETFHIVLSSNQKKLNGIWRTKFGLQKLAFSSAHKKILMQLVSTKVFGGTPKTTGETPVPP